MPELRKNILANTFKFDCDRFLKFKLLTEAEKKKVNLNVKKSLGDIRPAVKLIKDEGKRWESQKYGDLISLLGKNDLSYNYNKQKKKFDKVNNLIDILKEPTLPFAIIEAEFPAPTDITPGLQKAYDLYNLKPVKVRPDIIWLRPARTGSPLIGNSSPALEYELHVIDVKMAAEPTLRHFIEVTYYALALNSFIRKNSLTKKYGVSAEGFIWPGTHEINEFRNLCNKFKSEGHSTPVAKALKETLIAVPYEAYQFHVRKFFEERLLKVLAEDPIETNWHVTQKCQLCDYVIHCKEQAGKNDHLSRIPWLNKSQAEILCKNKIETTKKLAQAIKQDSPEWQKVKTSSHQLRSDALSLLARTEALETGEVKAISDRKCPDMPSYSTQKIFITVHFDPSTGITFALGTKRVYFPPYGKSGESPKTEDQVFIVDRVDHMNPENERARLVEFINVIIGWLKEVVSDNDEIEVNDKAIGKLKKLSSEKLEIIESNFKGRKYFERDLKKDLKDNNFTAEETEQIIREASKKSRKLSSHFYFWDMLELRQLKRMLNRHMNHPDLIDIIELLLRFFPPEETLPDADYFKSQPGTVVKEILRKLIGLPLPYNYNLLDSANNFHPYIRDDGTAHKYIVASGFQTPMSDQIPFERAYELWKDDIYLKHSSGRKYNRNELYVKLNETVKIYLDALRHIVDNLSMNYKKQLTLKKSIVKIKPSPKKRIPKKSRNLLTFEKLNVIFQELDNKQSRALPIEERESRFFSIRGLNLVKGKPYDEIIKEIKRTRSKYRGAYLLPFTFSINSTEAKIKEGDFLLVLSNEEDDIEPDFHWYRHLGISADEAKDRLDNYDLDHRYTYNPLKNFIQVTVVHLEPMNNPPFIILQPNKTNLFNFAVRNGIVDFNRPLVLDPIFKDFRLERVNNILKEIGGDPSS